MNTSPLSFQLARSKQQTESIRLDRAASLLSSSIPLSHYFIFINSECHRTTPAHHHLTTSLRSGTQRSREEARLQGPRLQGSRWEGPRRKGTRQEDGRQEGARRRGRQEEEEEDQEGDLVSPDSRRVWFVVVIGCDSY